MIYAGFFLCLNRCNSYSHYRASPAERRKKSEDRCFSDVLVCYLIIGASVSEPHTSLFN